jgi:histidinol-phosphate/aromatic aminotransferase/cobyric acid decarboxylase-like protein
MSQPERVHGGVSDAELARLGLARSELLDLSVNVNPAGPAPAVMHAIHAAAIDRYPQPWAAGARAALAESLSVDSARLVIGHGSTELLWSAVSLLRESGRSLLVVGPTFSEPALAARAHGVPCLEFRRSLPDFALDLAELSRTITACDAAGVYLCQPNNPDGGALRASLLRELCLEHPTRLFLLDQAFLSLSTRYTDAAVSFPDHVLVVRSLTKEHALAGLRVGYALGAPTLLERLNEHRPSWMVSTLAEAAVVAACAEPTYVAQVRERLLSDKAALAVGCAALGLEVVPSTTHYFLIRVPDADALRQRLLARHGVAVRSGSSFGLPEHIRICGCDAAQRERALAALRVELTS